MPLYEYRCLTCGHVFDVIQKFSDPPVSKCPECGKAVEKCVSSPAIQFKGSGFYITDYSSKGKQTDTGRKPKTDAAKADAPKADGSKPDAPKSDAPRTSAPKAESARPDKAKKAKDAKPKAGSGS